MNAGTRQPGGRKPAPGPLAVVQDFVNTRNIEEARDALENAAAASAWLSERGLLAPGTAIGASDAAELRRARESIRDLIAACGEGMLDADSAADLTRVARHARPRLVFDGRAVKVAADGHDVDAAITTLLLAVVEGNVLGTFHRLKTCERDSCRWAFYDHSPNASSRWCASSVCGNKAYTRAYRERRATR
jgi:predicted RNA-binding Zn ribbon-like protein